jgi:hypothetical protein
MVSFAAALADRLDPPEAAVFEALRYTPTPKQQLFHDATEWDVLYGGAAGGGKSRAITADAIKACIRYPGIRVGAFRRTFGELRESLITELGKMDFARALNASWNGSDYELRFPNGSVIMFRYAETIKDATRRQGGEYQLLVFDERTLTPSDVAEFLETRLRSGRADIPVLGIRSTANPGGTAHAAVKKRYIKPTNYGEKIVVNKQGRTIRFIPARLSDNPHMNPEYSQDLAGYPPDMRAAFLDGNWDLFAGAMFPELDRDRHVVDPFTLPLDWPRYNGIDWGYFPGYWAVIWGALDEDGRIWLYREAYEQMVIEPDQAKRILAAEMPGEHVAVRYADDAMWTARGAAKSSADMYADAGCYLTPAHKGERVIGWHRVRRFLAEAPACQHHRAQGLTSCPMLHMFSTLHDTYRTLSDLPHATKGNPEDADTSGEDHLPDALRYLLINLGGGPEFTVLDGPKPNPIAEEITPLEPMGAFAYRRMADEPEWFEDYEDQARRIVRTVRTAD